MAADLYKGMSDHDLLIRLDTRLEEIIIAQKETIVELKNADEKLELKIEERHLVADAQLAMAQKIAANVKLYSPFYAAIGGAIGAIAVVIWK